MLLPVDDAINRILTAAKQTDVIDCPLEKADGMVLAKDIKARRNQPPFAASAMDGYAVRYDDLDLEKPLTLIGEAAAGHAFQGTIGECETVRIFTGSPLPSGADTILIQEDASVNGIKIRPNVIPPKGDYVRPAGGDFEKGSIQLTKGTLFDFRSLSLAASVNEPVLPVFRRPVVGILSNGDELVRPGEEPAADQIIASNAYGIASIVRAHGGVPVDLGIVSDKLESIKAALDYANEAACDIIVTLGGASVGDHDLIKTALSEKGVTLDFWKIAMRPGKPFMFGRWGETTLVLGLPGNPVSSLVCALLFLKPLLLHMQCRDPAPLIDEAVLGYKLTKNSLRQAYLRCVVKRENDLWVATPFANQDSSLLSVLNQANALLIRPPHAPAAEIGDRCQIIRF